MDPPATDIGKYAARRFQIQAWARDPDKLSVMPRILQALNAIDIKRLEKEQSSLKDQLVKEAEKFRPELDAWLSMTSQIQQTSQDLREEKSKIYRKLNEWQSECNNIIRSQESMDSQLKSVESEVKLELSKLRASIDAQKDQIQDLARRDQSCQKHDSLTKMLDTLSEHRQHTQELLMILKSPETIENLAVLAQAQVFSKCRK
ncbi:hypothetical protein BX600DRAFT_179406 [Xylariales sp. PMI_506]|nr:hypothetical protein BX600DRAFT_179406 [Xylariales sp. PMI_506]